MAGGGGLKVVVHKVCAGAMGGLRVVGIWDAGDGHTGARLVAIAAHDGLVIRHRRRVLFIVLVLGGRAGTEDQAGEGGDGASRRLGRRRGREDGGEGEEEGEASQGAEEEQEETGNEILMLTVACMAKFVTFSLRRAPRGVCLIMW